ncbi:LacI family DNA-binding transcriptional regulator [Verticiella sediminum]|uniref:LacI family DNA-binding transcriptional regulator n=1 Tax=Verticiella sediminum TaxID=1247510 RepID=A0A556AFR8_9BURK|nr:substrate-binding domain-containing protein [Verticiella sediminum]TSH91732.1 LacI family DNA-binding transcriptional regulator [Verticiella sediminum]
MGKVSVRDVAQAAGVSIASVSRVLNGVGYASDDLRRRIALAVEQTGYVPDFTARHLRTGRSKAIGFMVSSLANPFLAAFFAAVETHMQAAGFSLLVAGTNDNPDKEAELVSLFENRRLEGIIASPGTEDLPRERNPFARCRLPLFIVDREVDWEADVLFQDHRSGVSQAIAYLASLGHRRIALFGPSAAIRPGREKLLGYRDGLQRSGLAYDPALVCMLRSAIDSPHAQMDQMLRLAEPPTALIGLGTRMLSAVLLAARRAGRRVPQDLSVIGIGTDDAFALMYPPMTMLRFDIAGAAQATAEMVLARLANPADPPRRVTLPLSLVLGETCRPPASRAGDA